MLGTMCCGLSFLGILCLYLQWCSLLVLFSWSYLFLVSDFGFFDVAFPLKIFLFFCCFKVAVWHFNRLPARWVSVTLVVIFLCYGMSMSEKGFK